MLSCLIIASAVSQTLLMPFRRCLRHHWCCYSGVSGTANVSINLTALALSPTFSIGAAVSYVCHIPMFFEYLCDLENKIKSFKTGHKGHIWSWSSKKNQEKKFVSTVPLKFVGLHHNYRTYVVFSFRHWWQPANCMRNPKKVSYTRGTVLEDDRINQNKVADSVSYLSFIIRHSSVTKTLLLEANMWNLTSCT